MAMSRNLSARPGVAAGESTAERTLEPVLSAAGQARELLTRACQRWNLPELIDPGCIVLTEMVNNVVAHAGTSMRVSLVNRAGALRISVTDESAELPQFSGPAPHTSAGGRGLFLIDSVAQRWGTAQLRGGKVVWALLSVQDERRKLPPGP